MDYLKSVYKNNINTSAVTDARTFLSIAVIILICIFFLILFQATHVGNIKRKYTLFKYLTRVLLKYHMSRGTNNTCDVLNFFCF